MRQIGHFIDGKAAAGGSGRSGDVFNPNTGEVQAKVAFASKAEVERAIASAEAAQPAWARMPQRALTRSRSGLHSIARSMPVQPRSSSP